MIPPLSRINFKIILYRYYLSGIIYILHNLVSTRQSFQVFQHVIMNILVNIKTTFQIKYVSLLTLTSREMICVTSLYNLL